MNKKKKIWLYAGIIGLILLALVSNLLFIFWVNPVLENLVKKTVANSTENKYHLDFDAMSYNPFSNDLIIKDLLLKADTTQIHTDSLNFYELKIKHLDINIGSIWHMLIFRTLVVEHVLATDPEIRLYRSDQKKDTYTKDLYDTYSFFSDFLYSLKIYKTQLKNLTFNSYKSSTDTIAGFTIKNVDAYFNYLKIDSDKLGKPGISKYTNDFQIAIRNFSNTLADSLYDIKIKEAKFDKSNNSVTIKDLELIPRYGKYEFARQVGHRIGRTELKVPDLKLSGVNFTNLLDHKIMETSSITASGFSLKSFTDKRQELPPRKRKLINQIILDIPFEFSADTIKVENGYIEYEEKTNNGDTTGQVTFEDLYASLYRVSNRYDYIQNDTMEADVKTKFMGKGNLDVAFKFPLVSNTGEHTIVGKLGNMSLTDINVLFEPAARTTVESGNINYLDFSMKLNEEVAEGITHFAYHDLKVKLLKSNLEEPELMENVASWIANVFIIKSDNPQGDDALRDGFIYYERDDEKTVFSYWVQALLIGIRESVGIKSIPKRLGTKATEEASD